MFVIVAAELGVLWLVGVLSNYTIGGSIHLLPVLATLVLVAGFFRGSERARMVATIMLIALGLVVFTYEGITYAAGGEHIEFVAREAAAGKSLPVPLAPMAGGIALMAGFLLLAVETHRADSGVNMLGSTPDSSCHMDLPTIESRREGSGTCMPRDFKHLG